MTQHPASAATAPRTPRRRPWLRSIAAIAGATLVGVLIAVVPQSGAPDDAAAPPAPTGPSAPSPTASPSPSPSSSSSSPAPTATPTTPELELPAPSPESEVDPAAPPTALDAVDTLTVAGRAPMTDYDRDLFAYREVDHDRNGCDVRNDVLRRDLTDVVVREGTQGCLVETGLLTDPYTGLAIAFFRGQATSGEVQIDHVVAMGNAWAMGAQQWDEETRHRFGNDPLNLLAVDGPANQSKGAGDAATWLPPQTTFRCEYVARQVSVKVVYDLRVTDAERQAMQRVLAACPTEPLVTADEAATP